MIVLNVCGTTRGDDGRAFQGLAPQLVRSGVPAVVTMQFPITDEAAATFAQEFYKRLCVGEDAGQVDVAVAYGRGMLAALHPGDQVGSRRCSTPTRPTASSTGCPRDFSTAGGGRAIPAGRRWPNRCNSAWRWTRTGDWPIPACWRPGRAHFSVPRRLPQPPGDPAPRSSRWRAAGWR